jgi:hypothetical protein
MPERWVIYQNGSTGTLPDGAVLDPATGEWRWTEAGVWPVAPSNPTGSALMRARPFQPGRGGGHLYAVAQEFQPGVFLVELLNDVTGEFSIGTDTALLQPGWHWKRHVPHPDPDHPDHKLRRVHWELVGVPRPNAPEAQWPWALGRLYPEWPPKPRRRR